MLPSRFEPDRFVSEEPRTARRMLRAWRLEAIREFFERELGVALALEEESGKLFPASNRARDVRDALFSEAAAAGVAVRAGVRVTDVAANPLAAASASGERFPARAIVLATGGLSIPKTGSDGTGIAIAGRLGHRVVEPYPALTPLRTSSEAHRALAGVSLTVRLRTAGGGPGGDGEASGGFLFTHGGYSGPSVLDVSHRVVRNAETAVRVRWGGLDGNAWEERLRAAGAGNLGNAVARALPARLARALVADSGTDPATSLAQLRREDRRRVVTALSDYRLPVSGHEGFARAEVTGGGVGLSEVDPVTLESRRVPGLYLCGEMLDAFGPIGGHNFLWAFVTGRTAGLAAAARIRGASLTIPSE